jgi:hypothetical protein
VEETDLRVVQSHRERVELVSEQVPIAVERQLGTAVSEPSLQHLIEPPARIGQRRGGVP